MSDSTLARIFEVLELSGISRRKLNKAGIKSYEDVVRKEQDLENGCVRFKQENGEYRAIKKDTQADLALVVRWVREFEENSGRVPDFDHDFTEETWLQFHEQHDPDDVSDSVSINRDAAYDLYKMADGRSPHAEQVLKALSKKGHMEACLNEEANEVIARMTPQLKECCEEFDYENFVNEIVGAVREPATRRDGESPRMPFYIYGRTQAGKSAVTAVCQTMCMKMKYPLIVLTKGVPESHELRHKLEKFAEGTSVDQYDVRVVGKCKSKCALRDTLVIADTRAQVDKALKMLEKYREGENDEDRKFILAVDESDAMLRTPDGSQQFERALKRLLEMKPALEIKISATLTPNLLAEREAIDVRMFRIHTSEQYVGVEDHRALQVRGDSIYLDHNELKHSNPIPYTNWKKLCLYEHALGLLEGSSETRRGVLLLDCTNPRVDATGNVFQMAETIQDQYHAKARMMAVVFVGRGIYWRHEAHTHWTKEEDKGAELGQMLEEIDKDFGLDIPVFVFGFSKMRRGISFRSCNRVPTHIAISLGHGHSVENLVQAVGRATYIGKDILNQNGFDAVTILSPNNDYSMVKAYPQYMEHVDRRVGKGDNLLEAMSGKNEKLPDSANFVRHTTRKNGLVKNNRALLLERTRDAFEKPDGLAPGEEGKKQKYWENKAAQRVMRVFWDLALKSRRFHSFLLDDIKEAFDDTYLDDDDCISKKDLRRLLGQFVKDSIVDKAVKKEGEPTSWIVLNPRALEQLMNVELAYFIGDKGNELETDDEADDEDASIDASEPRDSIGDRNRHKPVEIMAECFASSSCSERSDSSTHLKKKNSPQNRSAVLRAAMPSDSSCEDTESQPSFRMSDLFQSTATQRASSDLPDSSHNNKETNDEGSGNAGSETRYRAGSRCPRKLTEERRQAESITLSNDKTESSVNSKSAGTVSPRSSSSVGESSDLSRADSESRPAFSLGDLMEPKSLTPNKPMKSVNPKTSFSPVLRISSSALSCSFRESGSNYSPCESSNDLAQPRSTSKVRAHMSGSGRSSSGRKTKRRTRQRLIFRSSSSSPDSLV